MILLTLLGISLCSALLLAFLGDWRHAPEINILASAAACAASVALAIQVIRETFQRWWEAPDEPFASKLQSATKDNHRRLRPKKARYCPNYKDKPSAGKPVIRNATKWHKQRLRQHLATAA